jgi:hypothetical protein
MFDACVNTDQTGGLQEQRRTTTTKSRRLFDSKAHWAIRAVRVSHISQ